MSYECLCSKADHLNVETILVIHSTSSVTFGVQIQFNNNLFWTDVVFLRGVLHTHILVQWYR